MGGQRRFILYTVCLAGLIVLPTRSVEAQPLLFGSIDDPEELSRRAPWLEETSLGIYGGFSLIGPEWRSAARVIYRSATTSISTRFTGTFRTGVDGRYDPDVDELYDLVRTMDYFRLQSPRSGSYIRLGPLQRTRLGVGQVVNFHNSLAAWDERRVGVETSISSSLFSLKGFADDVNLHGLVGGEFTLSPFQEIGQRRLGSIALSFSHVRERLVDTPEGGNRFQAISVTARGEAWRTGAFSLWPFLGYSRIREGGDGYMFGADVTSDNFIDTARLHFRIALHLNGERFLPSTVGPFWAVRNPRARIIQSEPRDDQTRVLIGRPITVAGHTRALETEFRLLLFERLEFWYRAMRNFDVSSIGEFNARFYVRARQFRLSVAYDRGGLGGFFSLFNNLGDLTLLRFESAYRVLRSGWILVEARYTYERVQDEGPFRLYQIQRRFDPLFGFRLVF